jgi:hypothetical protein
LLRLWLLQPRLAIGDWQGGNSTPSHMVAGAVTIGTGVVTMWLQCKRRKSLPSNDESLVRDEASSSEVQKQDDEHINEKRKPVPRTTKSTSLWESAEVYPAGIEKRLEDPALVAAKGYDCPCG